MHLKYQVAHALPVPALFVEATLDLFSQSMLKIGNLTYNIEMLMQVILNLYLLFYWPTHECSIFVSCLKVLL